MQELLTPYHSSVLALLALAALHVLQFLVADIAAIRAKHVPGMPVTQGHDSILFRTTRAYANSYENLGLLLLVVLLCLFAGADPFWTGVFCWIYFAGRVGHMATYYADLRLIRSVFFGVGAFGQIGLLVCAFVAFC